ncbi:MAG: hypothetical protein OXE53_20590 [Deltaproteobacteria bacterium]|nr:hypothetical protein [Deltaproteobacteria bacterium]
MGTGNSVNGAYPGPVALKATEQRYFERGNRRNPRFRPVPGRLGETRLVAEPPRQVDFLRLLVDVVTAASAGCAAGGLAGARRRAEDR